MCARARAHTPAHAHACAHRASSTTTRARRAVRWVGSRRVGSCAAAPRQTGPPGRGLSRAPARARAGRRRPTRRGHWEASVALQAYDLHSSTDINRLVVRSMAQWLSGSWTVRSASEALACAHARRSVPHATVRAWDYDNAAHGTTACSRTGGGMPCGGRKQHSVGAYEPKGRSRRTAGAPGAHPRRSTARGRRALGARSAPHRMRMRRQPWIPRGAPRTPCESVGPAATPAGLATAARAAARRRSDRGWTHAAAGRCRSSGARRAGNGAARPRVPTRWWRRPHAARVEGSGGARQPAVAQVSRATVRIGPMRGCHVVGYHGA